MQSTPIDFTPSNSVKSTSLLAYQSRGHCLVIGSFEAAMKAAESLDTAAQTVLVPTAGKTEFTKRVTEDGIAVVEADALLVSGYLGAFDCAIGDPQSPGSLAKVAGVSLLGGFDLVLDLSESPMIQTEVLPFGYKAPGTDAEALADALTELSELQGDFEKPKYFEYDASICAHSRSGISACTNCVDACGAGAIKSNADGVHIEPYLCQGCGSCATSCPSGAVRYAYPSPADALSQLMTMLNERREQQLQSNVVYLYSAESGAAHFDQLSAELGDAVLPLAVEEVPSVGLDVWLCSIAFGVNVVAIDAPANDTRAHSVLQAQVDTANSLLSGLSMGQRVYLREQPTPDWLNQLAAAEYQAIAPATFQVFNDKRQMIRTAMDHLASHSAPEQPHVTLGNNAPFGQVQVNTSACTLCLACVSVCPGRALQDGETVPQLKFIESQCLQCGLCANACPEDAIKLSPRYLYSTEQARAPVVVNEEEPFNCVVCNTPFATKQIIDRMQSKLAGHWMFENEKAVRRLKMCEDCRVKDLFSDEQAGIDVHK